MSRWCLSGAVLLVCASFAEVAEPDRKDRGKEYLLSRTYSPASISTSAYDNVWKEWGLKEKPADFKHQLLQRYGLHKAPFDNEGYPMGLRLASRPLGLGKALSVTCLVCHGGSIAGKSIVGLGNASLDYQSFYEEFAAADGYKKKPPFQFCNVRGTNEAGSMSVFLLRYREPDLTVRLQPRDLKLQDDLCEDVPAWWHLKKKKTMYYTGGADARSVRSLMQFMMHPFNGPAVITAAEEDFKQIQAFLLTIEPPKYPLAIDMPLAERGKTIFNDNCSKCHGTYGAHASYPNRIVPIKEIGTDRRRCDGISAEVGEFYNQSWFAQEKGWWILRDGYKGMVNEGYQAPPLDGIWATAPYFHNGSVPTVYGVLNSKSRPKLFTRSYRTELSEYDSRQMGWTVQELDKASSKPTISDLEARKVYDTSMSGRGNGGHTYGDKLSEEERMAVIEYLKTL